MFDQKNIEILIQEKMIAINKLLLMENDNSIVSEMKSQLKFIESRMDARIKQSINHATEEIAQLCHIMNNIPKVRKRRAKKTWAENGGIKDGK